MKVTVLFFARARELVGTAETQLEIGKGSNTDSLAKQLLTVYPALAEVMDRYRTLLHCNPRLCLCQESRLAVFALEPADHIHHPNDSKCKRYIHDMDSIRGGTRSC